MSIITTASPKETKALAGEILEKLIDTDVKRGTSTIIALQGNLGAGKTVFVKGAAEHLGVKEVVTSPTYVIEKVYKLPKDSEWKYLVHIDAYRLDGEKELFSIRWNDLATNPNNLIVIEWPEQIGLGVPERAFWIEFETIDEHTRKITLPEKIFK